MSDPEDRFHEPAVKEGYAVDVYPVRWKPYKPDGQRQMKAKGRWQRMNEYGGWENCEKPETVFADPAEIGALAWREASEHPRSDGPNARRVLVWTSRKRISFGHRILCSEKTPPEHWPKDGWWFDPQSDDEKVLRWAYVDPPTT